MLALVLAVILGGMSGADARKLKGEAAEEVAREAANYIASIETLAASFDFVTPRGKTPGHLFIDRARQAIRMQFGEPLNHLLLVNGPRVQFFGGEGTVLEIGAEGTPFAFILRPVESLETAVKVLEVEERGDQIFLALAEDGNVEAGQVILKFQREPEWRLLDWGAFDSKGRFTQTVLSKQETGLRLDAALFEPPQ
jgi:outer membrane lipoprotein-sorting protein